MANNENSQFLPNQADIQAILSIDELVIFTKFHKDWVKIVDFSIKAYFWASNIFFHQSLGNSPTKWVGYWNLDQCAVYKTKRRVMATVI